MRFSFKLKKLIFLSVFFFIACFLFSQKNEDENSYWTIAVSEFKTDGLPSSYQSYKTIVPEMFLIYMDTGAKRIVPFEEKKMRAVMEASNKKLRLIKERAKLIKDRDELFLSVEDKKIKDEKEKKLTEEILKKEKSIYEADIDIKIEETRFFSSSHPKNINLWKYGESLYTMSENADLGENLKKENTALLAFNIEGKPDLFFKTRYYGTAPTQLKLPYQSTVLEFEKDKVNTYILLDKDKIPINEVAQSMVVKLNMRETKKLVERQRKVMYWSLGALYAILPAYLILNGVYSDKALAFSDGRLAQTQENAQNIRNLSVANITLQSLSIVAGINYFIQLIVYLVFSDRAIPRQPKIVNIDKPKHDITELQEETVNKVQIEESKTTEEETSH